MGDVVVARRWYFEAGRRAPQWLVETSDCTAIFDYSAEVLDRAGMWEIRPVDPVQARAAVFLLRPSSRYNRGTATPTRPISVSALAASTQSEAA
jgi:hypothetical protein